MLFFIKIKFPRISGDRSARWWPRVSIDFDLMIKFFLFYLIIKKKLSNNKKKCI